MEDYNQEKADTLVEALKRIIQKIENGYPVTEGQEKLIVKLTKSMLFNNPTIKSQYEFKKIKPQRLLDEDEEETNSGREPGE